MLVPEKFEFKFESIQPWTRLHPPSPLRTPSPALHLELRIVPRGKRQTCSKVSLKTLPPCKDFEDWSRGSDDCDPQLAVVLSCRYLSF